MRIEICGGIASGKSTLARLLSSFQLQALYEDFKNNPFLDDFYGIPERFAFETEITFILQHYHAIKKLSGNIVCDFSLFQDMAYAEMNLPRDRLKIFRNLHAELIREIGKPDLLIWLKCPPRAELSRIRQRCRENERSIDISYLWNLNAAIALQASQLKHDLPIIRINSEIIDFRSGIPQFIKDALSGMFGAL